MQPKSVMEIQTLYPNPQRIAVLDKVDYAEAYDVMGALAQAHNLKGIANFPPLETAVGIIETINPATRTWPHDALTAQVRTVLQANDRGEFGTAWEALQVLLDLPRHKPVDGVWTYRLTETETDEYLRGAHGRKKVYTSMLSNVKTLGLRGHIAIVYDDDTLAYNLYN